MVNRVTNSSMTNTFLRDIRTTLSSITKLQKQISTGKRISYPSDDPIGSDRVLDYRQTLAKMTQYMENIDEASLQAKNVDGALSTMETVMLRVRDLAVRGSNEAPMNQAEFDAIAEEIDSLIDEMVNQANQKFNGQFIFSGFKNDTLPFTTSNELEYVTTPGAPSATLSVPNYTVDGVTRTSQAITDTSSVKDIYIYDDVNATWVSVFDPPYNATGITSDPVNNTFTVNGAGVPFTDGSRIRVVFDKTVSVKYNGDIGEVNAAINDGAEISKNFIGATSSASDQRSVFGKYSSDGLQTSTPEAFQKLFDLRDSLFKYSNADNTVIRQQITDAIGDIDEIRQNITNVRAEQGGRVNRLDLAKNRMKNLEIDTKALLSKYEDVDMTEALSQFVLQQNVYQAALGVGARIIQTTLLDYLG